MAGETSIVIDHNCQFRPCERRGIVGNLADLDFDAERERFKALKLA